MCSSWSTRICFVSKRSRPISVDLPSSTEPHVTRRSRLVACISSEVANALPVFHRGFADAVVGTRLAAFAHPGGGDLGNDRVERGRVGEHPAGAGHVADGAEADGGPERLLVGQALDEVGDGV